MLAKSAIILLGVLGTALIWQPSHSAADVVVASVSAGAGGAHTCVVTVQGKVMCWGYNLSGPLGDGTTTTRPTPVEVGGLDRRVATIGVGSAHTCALKEEGGVLCWGRNRFAELGDGTTISRATPAEVVGLEAEIASIEGGGAHTCALSTGGALFCWGWNEHGQLGNGTTTTPTTPVEVVGLSGRVASMAAGGRHTCALMTSGGVKCWGQNSTGQLGDGTTANRTIPVDVVGLESGVVAIAAGSSHTCAVTESGGVKCWGHNHAGQLGNGNASSPSEISSVPVDVLGTEGDVTAVALGGAHTCALLTTSGVKCWGSNAGGQLGDGTTATRYGPVDVRGLENGVAALTVGLGHTCVLMTEGGVRCWGGNHLGQVGIGVTSWHATPVAVLSLERGIKKVTLGRHHTCALLRQGGGTARCWGYNYKGQIGDEQRCGTTSCATPAEVQGLAGGVTDIAAGWDHACAVTGGGDSVKCWGDNEFGQLGDGTSDNVRLKPVEVAGLNMTVAALAAGHAHTCALSKGDGRVMCWGNNSSGQVGDGTRGGIRPVPAEVLGLEDVISISAGYAHSCALTRNGTAICWGAHLTDHQIFPSPLEVEGLDGTPAAITSGFGHACAVMRGPGSARCWGNNVAGALGNGEAGPSLVAPVVPIGLESGVASIAAGDGHTCAAARGSGGVSCWGQNISGQLGNGAGGQFGDHSPVPVDVLGMARGAAAVAAGGAHSCAIMRGVEGVKCWGSNWAGQLGDGTSQDITVPTEVVGLGTNGTEGAADSDGDGCPNRLETATDASLGGQRDPHNHWDFYDVPTGGSLARDGDIASEDIFGVIGRFNATDAGPGDFDRADDPLSTPNPVDISGTQVAHRQNYHPAYDRTSPALGEDPWDAGPPDGAISAPDIFAVLSQFGHSCP